MKKNFIGTMLFCIIMMVVSGCGLGPEAWDNPVTGDPEFTMENPDLYEAHPEFEGVVPSDDVEYVEERFAFEVFPDNKRFLICWLDDKFHNIGDYTEERVAEEALNYRFILDFHEVSFEVFSNCIVYEITDEDPESNWETNSLYEVMELNVIQVVKSFWYN